MAEGSSSTFGSFVGRRRELAELTAALDEAGSGRGRLFLISGEPGIGKTRLADQVVQLATSRGMRALWGRCWEGGGAPAYWPWIQAIRALVASLDVSARRTILESEQAYSTIEAVAQLVPELHGGAGARRLPSLPPMDPEQARFRLFDAVTTLLKSCATVGPLVIILDDLHDADISSLLMLRFVARELDRIGMLIVGTYRDLEVRRAPELARQIGDLSREARALPLAGLSEAEVGQLYRAVAGQPAGELAARLHSATAGNPLYVDGIVRGLLSEREGSRSMNSSEHFRTPETLREAIGRRLAMLSEPTRSLLNIAAVIGNDFAAATCCRVGAVSRDKANSMLDEAAAAGILIALGDERFRFAHALIRSALYEALDTNRRVALHRGIGEALEEIHAHHLPAHLDELAHHYCAAGVTEKAIEFSHCAGAAAYAVCAYAVAAEHWREATRLTEGHRDARRADILLGLGQAEAYFLDPPKGIAHLEEALSIYRELNDDSQVAVTNVALGVALVFLADYAPGMNVARSLEHFREAQQWRGEWTNRLSFGWLHQGMATALFQQVRIEEALAAAHRAMKIWREAANPAWVNSGSQAAQLLSIKGRHRESAQLRHEVMQAVHGISDPGLFNTAIWYAGWVHMTMQNPAEARRYFTMGIEREGLSPTQRERDFEFLVMTEISAGNLARAREILASHQVNPQFQSSMAVSDGDFEGAIEKHRAMIEWARRSGHLWDVVTSLPGLAGVLRLVGDHQQALELLDESIGLYDPTDYWFETGVRPLAATLEIEVGRLDRAEAHLQVCRDILARGEDWGGRALLMHRAEGRLAAAQRRPFAAHFEKASAIAKRYMLPMEEADILAAWGSALLGEGDRAGADAKFDAAIEIYRRCGAGQRWIERVEAQRNRSASVSKASSSFLREGDSWAITYAGKTLRLRNIKGLGYVAHLLAHPGERIHVIAMVRAIEGDGDDAGGAVAEGLPVRHQLGDAGEVLDAPAREAYRRRLAELRTELDSAQRQNDPGRIEAARHELELLHDELGAAVGRGGRARKNLGHAERARSLVTKHIRSGLELIRRHDPALADHLDRSIRTGSQCAYLPEGAEKIAWQT